MRENSYLYHRVKKRLSVYTLSLLMPLVHIGPSIAAPPHHVPRPPYVVKPGVGRPPFAPGVPVRPYGRFYPALPIGYLAMMVSGVLFYYHAGAYYRKSPKGYVVVQAPPGAVVRGIPPGYQSVIINGVTYFAYGGVFYQQVPNGYRVVPEPSSGTTYPPQEISNTSTVTVSVQALNVRTGPGAENATIYVLRQGDKLRVIGTSNEWYYVKLPNGSQGWVNSRYTTGTFPAPQG